MKYISTAIFQLSFFLALIFNVHPSLFAQEKVIQPSSSQYDFASIIKNFPVLREEEFANMFAQVPGLKYQGRLGTERDIGATAETKDAIINIRVLNAETGYDTMDSICISYQNKGTKKYENIWSLDNPKMKEAFYAVFPRVIADYYLNAMINPKIEHKGKEYGTEGSSIYKRTNVKAQIGVKITPFADVEIFTNAYKKNSPSFFFEIAKGIQADWVNFKMYTYNYHFEVLYTESAFKNQITQKDLDEANKPYIYGSSQKRKLKVDPKWTYFSYIPSTYSPQKKYSLLLAFHGDGGTGEFFSKNFADFAEKNDYIILAPNFSWGGMSPENGDMYEDGDEDGDNNESNQFEKEMRKFFSIEAGTYIVTFSGGGIESITYTKEMNARAINSSGIFLHPSFIDTIDPNCPILLTSGDQDERSNGALIYYEQFLVRNYKKAELFIVPKTGHSLSKKAIDKICSFFTEVKNDPQKSYLRRFEALYATLSTNTILGKYSVNEMEADYFDPSWDVGEIYYDSKLQKYFWKNKANVKWELTPHVQDAYLETDTDNPSYEEDNRFQLFLDYDFNKAKYLSNLKGFSFNGKIYYRIN